MTPSTDELRAADVLRQLLDELPYRWDEGRRTTLTVPESIMQRATQLSDALHLRSTNRALLLLLQLGFRQLETMVALEDRSQDRLDAWREMQQTPGEDLDAATVDDLWDQALSATRRTESGG